MQHPSNHPRPVARFPPGSHRILGTIGIVAITFFIGCGGHLGSEPIVSSSGPLVGLIAMLVYPLLVTAPYGYILAELCTAFPEDGGFAVWVLNAFGPFWGFQVGYWSWVGGVFNAGLLPAFLLKVFMGSFGLHIQSSVVKFLVKVTIGLIVSLPAFLGTKSVERTCILLLVLVSIPMLVFTVWGFVVCYDYVDLTEVHHGGRHYCDNVLEDEVLTGPIRIDWTTLLNNLFWNYDGIAIATVFGGEVSNPARVYRRPSASGRNTINYETPWVSVQPKHWNPLVNATYEWV